MAKQPIDILAREHQQFQEALAELVRLRPNTSILLWKERVFKERAKDPHASHLEVALRLIRELK